MIDLKDLRENPEKYREGCRRKGARVDLDRILDLDSKRRSALAEQERLRSEQKALEKAVGQQIGKLSGELKKAEGAEKNRLQAELEALKNRPAALKALVTEAEAKVAAL